MIKLENITKIYRTGKIELVALKNINLEITSGEFVAIMGPSGSGKSTLLNILGCLDLPTSGNYFLFNKDVSKMKDSQLAKIRNSTFGFIFQNFNLLNYMNIYENIEVPLIYSDKKYSRIDIYNALEMVQLREWAKHKPTEISGGQQQRVAIARALITNPSIILADEPTGNLDSKSGKDIMNILKELNNNGKTIILVTHDKEVASFAHRHVHIRDGEIISDRSKKKILHIKMKNQFLPDYDNRFNLRKLKQNIWVAIKSIVSNKLRAFLTTLGIIIGVASVISMISIGEGAKKNITANIKNMGANLLYISPGASRKGMRKSTLAERNKLTLLDAYAIKREAKTVALLTPVLYFNKIIVYKNRNLNASIQGVNSSFPEINNYKIKYGSFFDDRAIRLKERVAVVGNTIVKELFDGKNPVGEYIKINRINFLIIGAFEPKGATSWRDLDNIVVIPISTAQKRLLGVDFISGITVKVKNEKLIPAAKAEITRILKRTHRIKHNQEPDFNIRSQVEILQRVTDTTKTFTLLLGGIASISLIVGGIGIMNIMLVTVMERIKEIGLRKAIGARRVDILFQFLTESITICFLGGFMGIILGVLVSKFISNITRWGTYIPLYAILLSFAFSFAVGMFFGIYPSYKASALNPIEALRYE